MSELREYYCCSNCGRLIRFKEPHQCIRPELRDSPGEKKARQFGNAIGAIILLFVLLIALLLVQRFRLGSWEDVFTWLRGEPVVGMDAEYWASKPTGVRLGAVAVCIVGLLICLYLNLLVVKSLRRPKINFGSVLFNLVTAAVVSFAFGRPCFLALFAIMSSG